MWFWNRSDTILAVQAQKARGWKFWIYKEEVNILFPLFLRIIKIGTGTSVDVAVF